MTDESAAAAAHVWTIDLKLLTIVGPVLTSALAILYDVGFFLGLNLDFFTFFSLSEHLVFALQAIPFAALTAATASGWFIGSWIGMRQTNDMIRRLQAEPELEKRKAMAAPYLASAKHYERWQPLIGPFILIMAGGSAVIGAYVSSFVSFLIGIAFVWKKTAFDLINVDRRVITAGLGVFVLVLAFLTGFERARMTLNAKNPSETIVMESGSTPARIIRSGERGVLFLATDVKKLRFIRWDAIKSIETL